MTITHDPPDRTDARLEQARVLVVGLGGLGCPAARALAGAGVGTLGLVDPDVVDVSNLPRQTLYDEGDLARPKVEAAAARLLAAAPRLHVEPHRGRLTADAAGRRFVAAFDVVIDGTDAIATKFALSDLAVAAGRPLVHAGVLGFRAQLLTILPGRSACYRCIFEDSPPPEETPGCEAAGVLGPVVAFAGTVQASEALRLLRGEAPAFANRLLTLDVLTGRTRAVAVRANPRCPACAAREASWIGRSEAS